MLKSVIMVCPFVRCVDPDVQVGMSLTVQCFAATTQRFRRVSVTSHGHFELSASTPPLSLRENEVQGAAGFVDLVDGGQALLVGSRDPELMDDAHELSNALVKYGHRALGIGVPGVA